MTTADRNARGRSLFARGTLPSSGRHLSRGEVAYMFSTDNAREGEYTTYAPKGERCSHCGAELASLEACRRVSSDGECHGLYVHMVCPTQGARSDRDA